MARKEKIVLIGAGSLQFGLGAAGSILGSEILEGSTISLHDIDEESLGLVENACRTAIQARGLDFDLEATTERQEALKNATFVINSIEVAPRFELWEQDYQVPLKYGFKHVFGENGGPGGFFHSLRVIPPILDICADMHHICPQAFLINFSNPMSRICLAVHRKFPDQKFVGLCHEFQHHIPIIGHILDTPVQELTLVGGGLNHFGVILDATYTDSGKDAYPDIRQKGESYLRDLKTLDGCTLMRYILEKYDYIPYTTDSHFGEYIHWAWDIADREGIQRFKDTYIQSLEFENKKIIRAIKKGRSAKIVRPDDERAIPIIEGILTDAHSKEVSVNIPNEGIITNLPQDLVVECPAIVSKEGLKGVPLGEYPKGLDALLRTQASVQDLVVEAILQESKDVALEALLADPVVNDALKAEQLLEEMLDLQKEALSIYLE